MVTITGRQVDAMSHFTGGSVETLEDKALLADL